MPTRKCCGRRASARSWNSSPRWRRRFSYYYGSVSYDARKRSRDRNRGPYLFCLAAPAFLRYGC